MVTATAMTAVTPGLPRAGGPLVSVSVQEMAIAVHWSEVGGFEVRVEKESRTNSAGCSLRPRKQQRELNLASPRQQLPESASPGTE